MRDGRKRVAQYVRQALLKELSRTEMTDEKAVQKVVMRTVQETLESDPEVLDYKVEIEDESPGIRLAREIMEDPVQEVSMNVSITVSGSMDKIFVGTMTHPDGHQTVSVRPDWEDERELRKRTSAEDGVPHQESDPRTGTQGRI